MIEVFAGLTCPLVEVQSYLQKEELLLLAILAKIYREVETPKIALLVDFLAYQNKTRFNGIYIRQQAFSNEMTILAQSHRIFSQNIQLIFIFMQLHLFNASNPSALLQDERLRKFITQIGNNTNEFKDLVKVLSDFKPPLDGIECVIYLTVKQVMDIIKKLDLFKQVQGIS